MIYCIWAAPIVFLYLQSEQTAQMEHSLAFDLHIMLCLPASTHLYISSDKIRAFSLKHLDCDTVLLLRAKAKHHICIARFLGVFSLVNRSKPRPEELSHVTGLISSWILSSTLCSPFSYSKNPLG